MFSYFPFEFHFGIIFLSGNSGTIYLYRNENGAKKYERMVISMKTRTKKFLALAAAMAVVVSTSSAVFAETETQANTSETSDSAAPERFGGKHGPHDGRRGELLDTELLLENGIIDEDTADKIKEYAEEKMADPPEKPDGETDETPDDPPEKPDGELTDTPPEKPDGETEEASDKPSADSGRRGSRGNKAPFGMDDKSRGEPSEENDEHTPPEKDESEKPDGKPFDGLSKETEEFIGELVDEDIISEDLADEIIAFLSEYTPADMTSADA